MPETKAVEEAVKIEEKAVEEVAKFVASPNTSGGVKVVIASAVVTFGLGTGGYILYKKVKNKLNNKVAPKELEETTEE